MYGTLNAFDSFLSRDTMLLSHFYDDLHQRQIKHSCGADYRVEFLRRDDTIFRHVIDQAAYEVVLTACCSSLPHGCQDRDTSYNYARIRVALHSTKFDLKMVRLFCDGIKRSWDDLLKHLESGAMIGRALIYEWLTESLAQHKKLHMRDVLKLVSECLVPLTPQDIIRTANDMGFIVHRPVVWTEESSVPSIRFDTYSQDGKVFPVPDVMFMLPPDHPLARTT